MGSGGVAHQVERGRVLRERRCDPLPVVAHNLMARFPGGERWCYKLKHGVCIISGVWPDHCEAFLCFVRHDEIRVFSLQMDALDGSKY